MKALRLLPILLAALLLFASGCRPLPAQPETTPIATAAPTDAPAESVSAEGGIPAFTPLPGNPQPNRAVIFDPGYQYVELPAAAVTEAWDLVTAMRYQPTADYPFIMDYYTIWFWRGAQQLLVVEVYGNGAYCVYVGDDPFYTFYWLESGELSYDYLAGLFAAAGG
ncbi:MAG: hypothetical protein FWF10_05765 [Clostridiales bacterium]|nr:hypothetical protein [Clostridiales bacterium]